MRYADRVTITAGFVTAGQRENFSRRSFPAVKYPFFLDNNGGIDCFPAVHFPRRSLCHDVASNAARRAARVARIVRATATD